MCPLSRKLKFVQFTHPGGEHTVSRSELKAGIKNWNTREHRRKFLKAQGQVVSGASLSAPQDLLFWGEWEPYSFVKKLTGFVGSGVMPKYVHEPFIKLYYGNVSITPPSYRLKVTPATLPAGSEIIANNSCGSMCFQNTDPFVFNDYFLYSLCKQVHFVNLRYLDRGSIVLFGSTISSKNGDPCFVVDTVFVVDVWKEYRPGNAKAELSGFIPTYYDGIMRFDYTGRIAKEELTCYHGATFHQPVNGMFSFVPCKPCDNNSKVGFSRPIISSTDFPGILNDNLNSSPKYSGIGSLIEMKTIWDKLCNVIKSQGFELGVNFKYKVIPKTGISTNKLKNQII